MLETDPPIAGPQVPVQDRLDRLLDEVRSAWASGHRDRAEELWQRAHDAEPDRPRVHAVRGYMLAATGDLQRSIAAYQRAVELDPEYVVAQHGLAVLLQATGRAEASLDALAVVLRLEPDHVDALRRRVLALADVGRYEGALEAARQAVERLPDEPELLVLQGSVMRMAGRPQEALSALEAILVQSPDIARAWAEKGSALHDLARYDEAMEAFDEALEIDGSFVFALNGLGLAAFELQRLAVALAAFEQALAIEPSNVDALFYRAMTLEGLGRTEESLEAYREVLVHRPRFALAYNNIAKIERDMGLIRQAQATYRKALAIDPDRPQMHSNLLLTMLYDPELGPDELSREHRAWGERFGNPPGRFTEWPNDLDPERPLSIGLVSSEFCRHAVSGWLLAALQSLEPDRFRVVCYSNRAVEDDLTERFKTLASVWRRVLGMDDRGLAELIRADGIDILIDISGHTAFNRLPCFALKPAPVQAGWLGYPYTTGLHAIDYCVMDEVAVHTGEEAQFVEEVVRLSSGRFCYEPPLRAPEVAQPPVMRNGWITFGSFNNVTKLTEEVLEVWCRILHHLPTSRLVLKSPSLGNPAVADRIRATICGTGITAARLELRGGSDFLTLLGEYAELDIALDPFPFGGGATSCEALWMGLPVVTLPSWQPVSRQTQGYLWAMGRSEWVASNVDEYIRIAAELASDPLRLVDLRMSQRDIMHASPLCDKRTLGQELERALRMMWRRYVATSCVQD